MKKKIVAILLGLTMSVSLMSITTYGEGTTNTEKKIEIVKEVETSVAKTKLKEALNKTSGNDNFETEFKMTMTMEGIDLSFNGNGTYDLKNNVATYKIKAGDKEFVSYVKDGENYSFEENQWKYEKSNEKIKDAFTIADDFDASFLSKFTVGETADSLLVFKNKESLTVEELKNLVVNKSSIFSSMLSSFDNVASNDAKVNLTLVVDKDMNLKEILFDSDMTQNGKPMKMALDFNFLNFNKAKEIKVPEEAIKSKNNPQNPISTTTNNDTNGTTTNSSNN